MAVTVVDLVDPSVEDLHALPVTLDPEAIEMLTAPPGDGRAARPSLESHGRIVVGVLLVPQESLAGGPIDYLEIDAIVAPNLFATIRKSSPTATLVRIDGRPSDDELEPGLQLHRLVDSVADGYLDLVDRLYTAIDDLEDAVDTLPGAEVRRRIAALRHELLYARRNASATRAAARRVLDGRLDLGDDELFPPPIERAFADTYDTLLRVTEELDIARDLLAGVRDYVQSRVSEAQNEVVKKLTVVASLVLVPTLITGFYGQNFAGAFGDWWWSLATSVTLIVVTTLAQLAFFRWKRWI